MPRGMPGLFRGGCRVVILPDDAQKNPGTFLAPAGYWSTSRTVRHEICEKDQDDG
jgi:hypothetical protein